MIPDFDISNSTLAEASYLHDQTESLSYLDDYLPKKYQIYHGYF